MNTEEKKKAVLEALKTFSKMQLDPGGKGRYILSLERDEKVTEKKISELYENTLKLQREAKEKDKALDKTVRQKKPGLLHKTVRQTVRQKRGLLLDKVLDKRDARLEQLENMVNLILVKQKVLEVRLASLEADLVKGSKQEKGKSSQTKKLLGFTLVQKSTSSQGKRYLKWYAVKRIAGKQVWVYVGEDVEKAKEKIREWMARHG